MTMEHMHSTFKADRADTLRMWEAHHVAEETQEKQKHEDRGAVSYRWCLAVKSMH